MINKIKQKLLDSMSVEELVQSVNSRDELEKRKVYDILLSECFGGVSLEELEKGFASLPSETQADFAKQAHNLKSSKFNLWLSNTLVKNIQKKLYLESTSSFDIAIAKIGLWQEKNRMKIIKDISNIHKQAMKDKKIK